MHKAILRKAGQAVKKVNAIVNPGSSMTGFFKKSNEIHICGKCGAEYFSVKPESCVNTIIEGVAGDACGSIVFTTVNSISQAEGVHAQREVAISA